MQAVDKELNQIPPPLLFPIEQADPVNGKINETHSIRFTGTQSGVTRHR